MGPISLPTLAVRTIFARRPAIPFLLLLAIGIGASNALGDRAAVCLCVAAALWIAAIFTARKDLASAALIALAIIFAGISATQIEHFRYPSRDISSFTTSGERFSQIELKLNESPRLLTAPPNQSRPLPPRQIALADVLAVRTWAGWRPASGRVALSVEELNPRLASGQIISITGMLQRPMRPANPGQFDWSSYYRKQRILTEIRVTHADGVQILGSPGQPVLSWLRDKARHLLAMGFPAERSFDHALMRALILGDSDPQLRDIQDEFARTGAIHYLSVSGLHIAIIGALALLICRLFRRSPRTSILISAAMVILYAFVALPSWPGVRSAIMCIIAAYGLVSRRPLDALQLLAVAVAAVLLIRPSDLADGGFQISFAAVLGMIVASGRLMKPIWQWWSSPDITAVEIRGQSRLQRGSRAVLRFALETLVAGAIAWLMAMPLVAYHFGQLSLWSAPAGIFFLPLTVVAMTAGIAKILLTLCWPTGAHLWAIACAEPIVWMRHAIDLLDRLPGSSFQTAAPSVWPILIYYVLLCLPLVRWNKPAVRWLARGAIVPASIALFLWPAPSASATPPGTHHISITLLSLGAGQTAIIRPEADRAVLIDAGSSTVSDVARTLLTPYLRAENCPHISQIFLSHGDFDHISAAADIFQSYSEPDILMSPHFARHAIGNIPAESLLKTLEDAGRQPHLVHRGDHLDLGDGATIDVLWPPADCVMNSNNCGLVLMLKYANRSVLFPADIQVPPEEELLRHPDQLKADILIAPHHGSAEISTAAFIKAVSPQMILASSAMQLTHKQKLFDELVKNYPLYRTSKCGAITVTIEEDGKISVETFNVARAQEAAGKTP